jgi:hypothetical protein
VVALVTGFTFFGPRGGFYAGAAMTAFVGQSPINVIVSFYLFAVSICGWIVVMDYLSDISLVASRLARGARGTSLLAAAALLTGWGLYFAPSTSVISGGPAIDVATTYTFVNAGFVVLFGVGGVLLGIALLAIAVGASAAPAWVRALTGLVGVSATLDWAFLLVSHWAANQWLPVPFYAVVLWGLVVGIWLLASPPRPTTQPNSAPEALRG